MAVRIYRLPWLLGHPLVWRVQRLVYLLPKQMEKRDEPAGVVSGP